MYYECYMYYVCYVYYVCVLCVYYADLLHFVCADLFMYMLYGIWHRIICVVSVVSQYNCVYYCDADLLHFVCAHLEVDIYVKKVKSPDLVQGI
jgi:hypothetical protein